MDTEALTKQRIEDLMAGYQIAGAKKKREPSAHNKLTKALMKKYGYTLGQASAEAKKLAGSMTAGSTGGSLGGSTFYDPDKFASIREERARARYIEDMELKAEEEHEKARENALANDPRYGQYVRVEKDYKDKKKALKALKEKELSPEQKLALRLEYEAKNKPKFSEISDVAYVAKKKDEKEKALDSEITALRKVITDARGLGRKKK